MSSHVTVQERNRELASRINKETLADPASPYTGKFVGLANGQVAVVADDLDTVVRELQRLESDPQKTFCLEASLDYDRVQYIWGIH